MRSHKPYINALYCKLNNNNQPILVSMNIKHISLIAYHISIPVILANVAKIMPVPLFCHIIPSFKRHFSIDIFRLLIEQLQFFMGYYSHTQSINGAKIRNNFVLRNK